jgi:5'-3' exonuclease
VAAALGWPVITVDQEEADDVIASYIHAADASSCAVATNDKDLMVLVAKGCKIYQPQSQGFSLLGPAEVEAKWGVAFNNEVEALKLQDYLEKKYIWKTLQA